MALIAAPLLPLVVVVVVVPTWDDIEYIVLQCILLQRIEAFSFATVDSNESGACRTVEWGRLDMWCKSRAVSEGLPCLRDS